MKPMEYAGFWIRTVAACIDTVLLVSLLMPLSLMIYGKETWSSTAFVLGPADLFISYVLPAVIILLFWRYKRATPAKMLLKLTIVDAKTGDSASTGQLIGRYFGYFLSTIPLGLGYLWAAWDPRKQTWHDKLSGTVVVKNADALSA